ncbi:MAG TPA: formate--tetrahydrofolate ligase [Lacibacter sp.]|nr:formate--tetrahydrofolate ligase [Lacibacter sp.]HMO87575.1 formate--tetrahydrofolate ligase [Lacibacter sp.]HMP87126.1 formate--tetrahydrofolate ligase [Lacibacter sp.]
MPVTVPSDITIAQSAPIRHIRDIAASLGIAADDLEYYGKYKAKLPLSLIDDSRARDNHLILVTAITPTPLGEGKTTVAIGLTEGLNRIGKKTIAVLREPSLGPVFGVKGGAAGGGYSQVIPMEDINLHFTGDFSAVEKANNLLSAMIDNNLQSKARNLGLDPRTIVWKRVMDMNDRSLRHIIVGLGGTGNGVPREEGFNITPASEIMAILCMSRDMPDLKARLGNIFIGMTFEGKPVFARDLQAVGAMAVLLKDAIKPNLVQTLEGNPAILHGGPFASIAQGTNSVIATRTGLSLAPYVVTEAGFGADLGAEKFFDIKSVSAGLQPAAVVVVATVKALRYHGGAKKEAWLTPSLERVEAGLPNLRKHLENLQLFGMRPVVAINHFSSDAPEEVELVQQYCHSMGIQAILVKAWEQGGKGCETLAEAVALSIARKESKFRPLYQWNLSVEEKIHTIATRIYGADTVEYAPRARKQLKEIPELGFAGMPVCMAKTPRSFSDDESRRGRPQGFTITVREFEYASGAGFVIPILGDMMRMPGLPAIPSAEQIDIDEDGRIVGLF